MWKIGRELEKYGQIGMGLDNASFSIFLAGCNSTSSHVEMIRCYKAVDLGFGPRGHIPEIADRIRTAESNIYQQMVPPHILRHIFPLPQIHFNEYNTEKAKYVLHFAGTVNKNSLLLDGLKLVST